MFFLSRSFSVWRIGFLTLLHLLTLNRYFHFAGALKVSVSSYAAGAINAVFLVHYCMNLLADSLEGKYKHGQGTEALVIASAYILSTSIDVLGSL